MQLLKVLISVVSPHRLKNIKFLGGPNSKIRRLYKGISEQTIEEESTAIALLFPEANNPKQAFADLKRATRKSLIEALFIVNYGKDLSAYQKNYINCLKHYAAINILSSLGLNREYNFMERTLNKAIANEYTELALSLSRKLLVFYDLKGYNPKKYYQVLSIVKIQHEHLNKEIILKNYFSELNVNLKLTKKPDTLPMLLNEARIVAEKYVESSNTYITLYFAYHILIFYYEVELDIDKVIYYAEGAISALSTKKHPLPNAVLFSFYAKSIPYAFQNRDWKKAEGLVDKCLKLLSNKSYNYHVILVYRAMLAFHSGQYDLAYESLQWHKKAKLNSPRLKEQWQMIEAWVMLFADWGKIDLGAKKSNFRVFKFINSTPNFTKDKPGQNAMIQVLKFLFFLQRKDYDKLLDINTAFRMYSHRYLKKEVNSRTRHIVMALCSLADEGFDKKLGIKKAKPFYKKIKAEPVDFLKQRTVEIVPFELVLETVFEHL